jgi:Sulfotransferase family
MTWLRGSIVKFKSFTGSADLDSRGNNNTREPELATNVPLIISGAPRSGTTLLYNLFDGHSQIGWLVEEGFLFEYFDRIGIENAVDIVDAIPNNADALTAGLRSKQLMPPIHEPVLQGPERGSVTTITFAASWSEEKFRMALQMPRSDGIRGFWNHLANAYLAAMGQTPRHFACMKAPDFGRSARAVTRLISDARAITIVRNPLYALDSLKRSREMRNVKLFTWPEFAQNVFSFKEMERRLQEVDHTRNLVVRYESLVTEPEKTMRGVAQWLGIEFEQCLLEPTVLGKTWSGISSFQALCGIERAPLNRRVQTLTVREQDFIRRTLSTFFAKYRYE